jgi:hypothetical protein
MFNPPITGDMPLDSYLYDLHLALEANTEALDSSIVPPDIAAGEPGTYVYRYIAVKYADDNIGTNLSNSPTNRSFFGVFNSGTTIESTNPADYTWYEASVPFGLSRSLYYLILGGRQIKFAVALTAPDYHWKGDDGSAIDLDVLVPDNTLSTNQIINGAITTDKLNAGAVTADKINAGAITADKIYAGAVTSDAIFAGAVTADKIGANAITAVKINAGAVTSDKIFAGAVTADKITSGAITADKIDANAVTAVKIDAGAITAAKIDTGAVTADKIYAGAVTADKISTGAVVADKISTGAITASKIDTDAVTADKIFAGSVTTDKLSTGAVVADKISAGAVTANKISVSSLSAVNTETGNLTIGSAGSIKGGQSGYNSGTGFFLGYSGATYKFSIGSSSQSLLWDGSNLLLKGGINAVGNVKLDGTDTGSLGTSVAADVNSSGGAVYGLVGYSNTSPGAGVVGYTAGGAASGVLGLSSTNASIGVNAVNNQGATGIALQVLGLMYTSSDVKVDRLNADLLDGYDESAFVKVAGGTSNGKYLYYVNNNTAPSNTTTMAAWIKVQTNDGAVVWIPGYF